MNFDISPLIWTNHLVPADLKSRHFSSEFGQYLCIKRTKSEALGHFIRTSGHSQDRGDISTVVRTFPQPSGRTGTHGCQDGYMDVGGYKCS